MADTQRTKSALATLFADNTTGAISAQDLRDFLESMHPADGEYYVSSAAATSISVSGTYVKVAGTTSTVHTPNHFTHSDNRLTYSGTPDIHVHISVDITFTGGAGDVIGFKIAKNGTVVDASRMRVVANAQATHVSLQLGQDCSNGDYFEIWVTNDSDTTNITVQDMLVNLEGRFE